MPKPVGGRRKVYRSTNRVTGGFLRRLLGLTVIGLVSLLVSVAVRLVLLPVRLLLYVLRALGGLLRR